MTKKLMPRQLPMPKQLFKAETFRVADSIGYLVKHAQRAMHDRIEHVFASQNVTFQQREINRSFVQMQYFGYLRRNPNDPPDGNFAGFDFWLGKLNQFNGDFVNAQMVQAFISSEEYRARFGP